MGGKNNPQMVVVYGMWFTIVDLFSTVLARCKWPRELKSGWTMWRRTPRCRGPKRFSDFEDGTCMGVFKSTIYYSYIYIISI
jgi:hypothetical protein